MDFLFLSLPEYFVRCAIELVFLCAGKKKGKKQRRNRPQWNTYRNKYNISTLLSSLSSFSVSTRARNYVVRLRAQIIFYVIRTNNLIDTRNRSVQRMPASPGIPWVSTLFFDTKNEKSNEGQYETRSPNIRKYSIFDRKYRSISIFSLKRKHCI